MNYYEIRKLVFDEFYFNKIRISEKEIKSISNNLEGKSEEEVIRKLNSIVSNKLKRRKEFSKIKSKIYKILKMRKLRIGKKKVDMLSKSISKKGLKSDDEIVAEIQKNLRDIGSISRRLEVRSEFNETKNLSGWSEQRRESRLINNQ